MLHYFSSWPLLRKSPFLSALAVGLLAAPATTQTVPGPVELLDSGSSQLLVDALDLDSYKAHIQNLSSLDPPINGTRFWSTAGNAAARDYIQSELESYGYTVERHSYLFQSTNMDQVYATKIGKDPSSMYIVGAHMDSTNLDSGQPQLYAPGANDDASGTSLVLEVARVFAPAEVETDVSIRFVLWNNEETGLNGSRAYVSNRQGAQGIEDPPGSGLYPEPAWLGVIQHDMMLWDHGSSTNPADPPWPPQDPNADLDIEYQALATEAGAALALARSFLDANAIYATDYPAELGSDMCCTDSVPFRNIVAAISLRENRRASEIGMLTDPHWHQDTDFYETFGPEDFLLGFNAAQTTTGALAELVNATVTSLSPEPPPRPVPEVCTASEEVLCLNQGRFHVVVEWQDFESGTGAGQVVTSSEDSGVFWFFDADNWEMMVKVLDGCAINGRFWVFAAGMTNVGYTLRVSDTQTGTAKDYVNPLGTIAPAITDTRAFLTCP